MNVDLSEVQPGTWFVSHGSGLAGELIRSATGSWAGHAGLYLGNNVIVQGQPPVAVLAPATEHDDALWAHGMWDWLRENKAWSAEQITTAQSRVVSRGHALVGCRYDFEAYAAFALEVTKLRNAEQLSPFFQRDEQRVCSALVADAEEFGGVPLDFIPSDGPGLTSNSGTKVIMPPNLVPPGMLLGLGQRLEWM